MTYNFGLDFAEPNLEKGDLPGPVRMQISVKAHTGDARGGTFITPVCVSMGDFTRQLARLRGELYELEVQANRIFEAHEHSGKKNDAS